jgi:hypothetical protein
MLNNVKILNFRQKENSAEYKASGKQLVMSLYVAVIHWAKSQVFHTLEYNA